MEFISSFTPIIKVDEADGEETVLAWKFTLCGYNWEIDAQVLRDWFRFPKDGLFPRVIDERVFRFWKRISGIDYDKDEHHYSTKIKLPIFKLLHKILGGIIFVRSNYGRTVKKLEMTVMMMMEKEQEVDWLWCITNGLLFNQAGVQNRGMGGGSFVTWIAKKLNITFEGGECVKKELSLKDMKHRHILGKGLAWKNAMEEESEEDEEDDGSEEEQEERGDVPPTSSVPPQTYSDSKQDLILATLKSLVSSHHALANYVSEHNAWEDRTLLAMASHLNMASVIELPPKSPFMPRSPSPPRYTSEKGKGKMGEPSLLNEEEAEKSLNDVVDSVRVSAQEHSKESEIGSDFVDQFLNSSLSAEMAGMEGSSIAQIDKSGGVVVEGSVPFKAGDLSTSTSHPSTTPVSPIQEEDASDEETP